MIFSNSLATQETLDRTLASVNMASAPETTTPFPSNKSKKSKRNRDSTNLDNAIPPPNNACAAATQPTRHLEFNQAMRDFKVMFPKMDLATIETVLRANSGAVDATIDQLLTLTEDIPDNGSTMGTDTMPLGLATNHSPQLGPQFGPQFGPQLGSIDHQPPQLGPTFTGHSPPPMYRGPVGEEQPPPYSPPSPTSPFSQMNRPTPATLNTSAEDDCVFQEFMSTLQASPPPSIQSSATFTTTTPTVSSTSFHRRRWNPPLLGELPDHFLRIPTISQTPSMVSSHLELRLRQNVQRRSNVDKDDVEMQQMLNDERVALFMQNEEFMRELQHNPEFSEALERDVSEATREASLRNHRLSLSHQTQPGSALQQAQIPIHRNVLSHNDMVDSGGAVGGAVGGSVAQDDVVFRNKLKHMGKSTKVKFAQMARKFNSKKKKKSSRAGLEGSMAPSTLNLIESEEEDERNLLTRRPKVEENIYSESNLI